MPSNRRTPVTYRCSFCGKSKEQVRRLIAGPGGVYICDECVDVCREIIDQERQVGSSAQPHKDATTTTVSTPSLEEDPTEFDLKAFFTALTMVDASSQVTGVPYRRVHIEFVGRPPGEPPQEFFMLGHDSAGIVARAADDGAEDTHIRFYPWTSVFCLTS